MSYITLALGWNTPLGGPESFGQCVFTNVGGFGFKRSYAPLCPPMRSAMMVCTGATLKKPIVD